MTFSLLCRTAGIGAALLAASIGFSSAGHADLIYNLNQCNFSGCVGPAPYATVTVAADGTDTLKISVTVNNSAMFVNTGGAQGIGATFGFDLSNFSSLNFSNFTAATGFTSSNWSAVGGANPVASDSIHMDGAGNLDYGIDWALVGGSNPGGNFVSFDISATGLTLTTFAAGGGFFAADLIDNCTGNTQSTATC